MPVKKYGPFERYVEVPHEFGVTGVPANKLLFVNTDRGAARRYWLADNDVPVEDARPATEHPLLVGGGWYELSDGTRVQGAESARLAQDAIDGR